MLLKKTLVIHVVKEDSVPSECKCHMFAKFVNLDCGHVVTGDVNFVKHDALRRF